ncbi:lipid A biosynthesis acyltransferase [Megasphaera cerevisiae DSM 20462]|uniref:Lipid A biosynthesis acyltransferase n=1 Tax=Megasphaera cerevisiae DSM 20462 TaxID=1122219 RepID=A0A0J6ZQ07_9FIRM|nr:lysophospholipid acyltransferase family protein [Megasphaera cerevisiae]KMO86996.1 lipid A biosynthesis acyltransferase [Megasphaera cerevisiae DSM 20462]MCI1750533.1 lysophospholipid acyltransferase family protein [Megasphaera cerevisiae]OKY54029.1 lipid A biosynthesis acyltransferase [Megasphaera cerevisiae]SJZ82529.1 KDO2-lipid IV(A) lauroyltransferase [Megasphaera cerevisiae DSM 20462]
MFNEWQYYAVRGLEKILCHLSYPTIISLGRKLGPLVGIFLKKQRRRGVFHVMRGMHCSEREAYQIIDGLFSNLGQSLAEILYTPRLNTNNIADFVTLDHPERLEEALQQNKGVIVLTGHIGNWEWMGASLALYGYPTTTIVKKQPNDQVTRLLNENRKMMGLEVFARGGNEMVIAARALKRKKILGFLADQDGGFHGVPQVFLGKMSSTPKGPAMFARKFRSPIIPVFAIHDERHHHKVVIGEIMYYEDTGNKEEDVARLTRKMAVLTENFIKAHPTEWLWFQHRWSTEPEDIIALHQKPEADGSDHTTTEKT